ncbi:MAG: hypothetical protein ACP5VQ_03560 [Phycisphaerae bacterium]
MSAVIKSDECYKPNRSGVWAALLVLGIFTWGAGGCEFLGMAVQNTVGVPVKAQYNGLKKQSVAIVVYEDASTMFTYPQAPQEVSAFVSASLKKHIPTARILNYHLVLDYQNANPNWDVLPIKTIGRHFAVARVVYIELLDYTVHSQKTNFVLQGHIAAHVAVYNVKLPGSGQVFHTTIDALWPKSGPLAGYDTDANTVRMNTLQRFSTKLAHCFYNWHDREAGFGN